jgi:hypothetical protein
MQHRAFGHCPAPGRRDLVEALGEQPGQEIRFPPVKYAVRIVGS